MSEVQTQAGWRIPVITDAEFERLRGLIRAQAGIHLRDHKRQLLVGRLAQRLRALGLDSFSAYYERVSEDSTGEELRTLINLITTNKTSFFREPHHFEFLRSRLIPEARQRGQTELRIWSAGCSTGEEPYTIAMTVAEALGQFHGWKVRILASDIDTEVLARARAGTYPLDALEDVSAERRQAHFLRGYGRFEGMAQVRPELQKTVEFRRINLSVPDWGLVERFDAIFCRNVIIYFDLPTQQRIVERLAERLKPEGYFFSGHSENLSWLRPRLAPVGTTVYRWKQGAESP
jgi:chemotaxis protein methyltransferase CheR